MGAQHRSVAAATGPVTPTSENARLQPGAEGQGTADNRDCARIAVEGKRLATLAARAALLGIELRIFDDGAWLMRHAFGADIGIVRGAAQLAAAVAGFEAARSDVAALVQRMRGAA